jgi:tetratricopeptide (TPR) repeat protein
MNVASDAPMPPSRRDWLTAAALAAVTFAVFAPALDGDFVNFDDPDYVSRNPYVMRGLTADGVRWAFTAFHTSNWHPLTWLSLQLDATVWGPGPRGFHRTNVLLHAANAALLFLAVRGLTGAFWRSAAVALLFAVHPLRVESVAWVAERKDVLSAGFGLLALWAYAGYARRPSALRYGAVMAAFVLSLLAKPMLVTLPCLFLVLDWWPLRRVAAAEEPVDKGRNTGITTRPSPRLPALAGWRRLAVEKLPLFVLVAASAVVTVRAQSAGGAVSGLQTFPLPIRLGNAAVSYVTYLSDAFFPTGLAVYYPHRSYPWGGGLAPAAVAAAALLLLIITAAAVVLRRRAPYLLTGWLWYAGTLVPVIGLVQVGGQAYADRYTYFPQIGILLAVCWGVADLARSRPRAALSAAAVAAVVLASLTSEQLQVWRNSRVLWEHDLAVARKSPEALHHLGQALAREGHEAEAITCYRKALELDPTLALAHNNLGDIFLRRRKFKEAAEEIDMACQLDPKLAVAHTNRGIILFERGELDRAAAEQQTAIELDPLLPEARSNLGQVELARHHWDAAADCYREALQLRPGDAGALVGLGAAFWGMGKPDEALKWAREALRRDPGSEKAKLLISLVAKGQESPREERAKDSGQ